MSRIGKTPIDVPQGVVVDIKGNRVVVTGPKGELSRSFNPDMKIKLDDNILTVSRPSDGRQHRSLHGLTRTLLANMVNGVSQGFEKTKLFPCPAQFESQVISPLLRFIISP